MFSLSLASEALKSGFNPVDDPPSDDEVKDPTFQPPGDRDSETEESESESAGRSECGEVAKTSGERNFPDAPDPFNPSGIPAILVGVGPKGGVRIVTPGGFVYRADGKSSHLICSYTPSCRPRPQGKQVKEQSLRCGVKTTGFGSLPMHYHSSTPLTGLVSFWRVGVLRYLEQEGPKVLMSDQWWEQMLVRITITKDGRTYPLSGRASALKKYIRKYMVSRDCFLVYTCI
jgi:hypothetical protein